MPDILYSEKTGADLDISDENLEFKLACLYLITRPNCLFSEFKWIPQ